MKSIIEGRVYDTATAAHICDIPCETYDCGNWRWHATALYKSPRRAFFLAGEGGPLCMWQQRTGSDLTSGAGIRLVTEAEARLRRERRPLRRGVRGGVRSLRHWLGFRSMLAAYRA